MALGRLSWQPDNRSSPWRRHPLSGSAARRRPRHPITARVQTIWEARIGQDRLFSKASGTLQQQPDADGNKAYAGDACNEPAERYDLLGQHQNRKRGDPQEIHDAADKKQSHERPAAADTIEAMTQSQRHRPGRIAAKAAVAHDESQRRLAI